MKAAAEFNLAAIIESFSASGSVAAEIPASPAPGATQFAEVLNRAMVAGPEGGKGGKPATLAESGKVMPLSVWPAMRGQGVSEEPDVTSGDSTLSGARFELQTLRFLSGRRVLTTRLPDDLELEPQRRAADDGATQQSPAALPRQPAQPAQLREQLQAPELTGLPDLEQLHGLTQLPELPETPGLTELPDLPEAPQTSAAGEAQFALPYWLLPGRQDRLPPGTGSRGVSEGPATLSGALAVAHQGRAPELPVQQTVEAEVVITPAAGNGAQREPGLTASRSDHAKAGAPGQAGGLQQVQELRAPQTARQMERDLSLSAFSGIVRGPRSEGGSEAAAMQPAVAVQEAAAPVPSPQYRIDLPAAAAPASAQPASAPAAGAAPAPAAREYPGQLGPRLMEIVASEVEFPDGTAPARLRVEVTPPELGTLEIELTRQGEQLDVRILASSEAAVESLRDSSQLLRDLLARHDGARVSVGIDLGSRGGQAGRDQRAGTPDRDQRTDEQTKVVRVAVARGDVDTYV